MFNLIKHQSELDLITLSLLPLETRAQNVFIPVRDMVLINLLFYKSDWDEVCTQRHPKKETETNSPAHELDLLVQGKLKLKRLE